MNPLLLMFIVFGLLGDYFSLFIVGMWILARTIVRLESRGKHGE